MVPLERIALIDGDIVLYASASAAKYDNFEKAAKSFVSMIEKITTATQAVDDIVYLQGEGNFRVDIHPTYKANRKDSDRPKHYHQLRKFCTNYNLVNLVNGMEVDDALGIASTYFTAETDLTPVICTLDKDLNMVPGLHYNWRSNLVDLVTVEEAYETFCTQCLTGDATDNIPGLYKTTGRKATRVLKDRVKLEKTFPSKWGVVRKAYGDDHFMELLDIAEQLWILR